MARAKPCPCWGLKLSVRRINKSSVPAVVFQPLVLLSGRHLTRVWQTLRLDVNPKGLSWDQHRSPRGGSGF
jgi:hypothetical protein